MDKLTTVQVCGERTWRKINDFSEKFLYHISPNFKIIIDSLDGYYIFLTLKLHITGISGESFTQKASQARSKKIRRSMWNHEWFNRYLAVIDFLSNGEDKIILGENSEEKIIISTNFLQGKVQISVVEEGITEIEDEFEKTTEFYEEEYIDDEEFEEEFTED